MQLVKKLYVYSMFHINWTIFKFNRNQLGTVSACHVTLANCLCYVHTQVTIEYRNSVLKEFHLKPNAAINKTKISSLICKTILIFNEHNFQYLIVVHSPTVKFGE